jgi:hypothetical protein
MDKEIQETNRLTNAQDVSSSFQNLQMKQVTVFR